MNATTYATRIDATLDLIGDADEHWDGPALAACESATDALMADDLKGALSFLDDAAVVVGGPAVDETAYRSIKSMLDADAALAEAVVNFDACDDDDDEEIATARNAVLDAAANATPAACAKAHAHLGWAGLLY